MNEFDYLNQDVLEWASTPEGPETLSEIEYELLTAVRDHYLPEFEAAIWKLAAANATRE